MDMRFYADGEGRVYRFLWKKFRESAERAAAQEGRGKMKERLEVHDVVGRFRIPFPTPWERRMRKLYFAAADGDEAVYFTRELQETLVCAFRQMR